MPKPNAEHLPYVSTQYKQQAGMCEPFRFDWKGSLTPERRGKFPFEESIGVTELLMKVMKVPSPERQGFRTVRGIWIGKRA